MPSSTIDKLASSTKSFIETFTSSDNPTTTFTEHTVAHVTKKNGIFFNILSFVSHPKFKWYILGIILCVVAFIYFKFQNIKPKEKLPNENKQEFANQNDNINVLLETRDNAWLSKINTLKQQFNTQLATQADVNAQLLAQLQNAHKHTKPSKQPEQSSETNSSEEIFIEDKNVQEHNLTADEMNAIDKQLEDVNMDHLMPISD